MDVEVALREVDEAVNKHAGTREWQTQRAVVERTLREVNRLAGGEAVEDLVRWLGEEVRAEGPRPRSELIEHRAAELVRERDHEIPDDSPLAVF
jgi:hypothetical protein